MIFLAVLIWVGTIRVHNFHAPFDRDVGIYTVIGHEMMHGRQLYTDLFDHKPPAIYLTFAAAELVAGYGEREIFLANIVAVMAMLVCLFMISRRLGSGLASLWIVIIAGLAVSTLQLEAVDANSEIFINAFLVGAFACVAGMKPTWPRLLGAAALTAIASLYKHVAVVPGAAFIAVIVAEEWAVDRDGKKAVGRLMAAGAVIAGFWAATALYFVARGRGGDFYDAMVRFNIGYAGFEKGSWFSQTFIHLLEVFQDGAILPMLTVATVVLAPILLFIPGNTEFRRLCRLTSAYLAGALVAVILPNRYFSHYFQLLYPPVAVAAGLLAVAAGQRRPAALRALAHALCLALALPLAVDSFHGLRLTTADAPQRFGYLFVAPKKLGQELDRRLAPSETFFDWGQESWLYFYSHRRPPAGIFIADHIRQGALKNKLTARTLTALKRNRPEIVVVSRWVSAKKAFDNPVGQWILENYEPLPDGNRGFVYLMARKGGRIWAQAAPPASPGTRPLHNHLNAVTKKVDPRLTAVERG